MGARPLAIASFLLTLLVGGGAHAEVYRWVDEDGTVHYSDEPREGGQEAEQVDIPEVNSAESVDVSTLESRDASDSSGDAEVIMYSASWCGYCDKAGTYFERNGIPFTEYDVEDSEKGRTDHAEMSTDSVPVILVGDQRMIGFSVERFERLYES